MSLWISQGGRYAVLAPESFTWLRLPLPSGISRTLLCCRPIRHVCVLKFFSNIFLYILYIYSTQCLLVKYHLMHICWIMAIIFLSFSLSGLPPQPSLSFPLSPICLLSFSLCWWLYSGLSMQGRLVWYSLYFDLSINMHTSVRRPLCVCMCVCFCLCVYAYVCIHMKARENP